MADAMKEIQDSVARVTPVDAAWTPQGDIYVVGAQGHILKVGKSSIKY